jgi:hypothetical protein
MTNNENTPNKTGISLFSGTFFVLSLGFLVLAFALILLEQKGVELAFTGAGICLMAAALILLASRWNDVIKFSLSKSEISAEFDTFKSETNANLKQLQDLAISQSKMLLYQAAAGGRYGGVGANLKYTTRDEVVASLEALDIDQQKINEVLSIETPFLHKDYASAVVIDLGPRLTEENKPIWDEFWRNPANQGIGNEPSPERLETLLKQVDLLDDETRERLEDYRHFHETGEHRRPDQIPF